MQTSTMHPELHAVFSAPAAGWTAHQRRTVLLWLRETEVHESLARAVRRVFPGISPDDAEIVVDDFLEAHEQKWARDLPMGVFWRYRPKSRPTFVPYVRRSVVRHAEKLLNKGRITSSARSLDEQRELGREFGQGRERAPAEDAARRELVRTVRHEILRLPVPLRRTLVLRFRVGLDRPAIASRLGVSARTVSRRIAAGQGILRSRLRDFVD